MPDEDDDLTRGRQRENDQQEASESRLRKLMSKVSAKRRDEFWLRLGFDVGGEDFGKLKRTLMLPAELGINVNNPTDIADKKEALAWAVRAQKRAEIFGKRLLLWITMSIDVICGLMGILKYLQDWRHP